ncbi:hypothetical protein [Deinococcus misasensis]|uniref:hypothetical protein n=1 Tax=Deinococcus misasensis TaxID=392413 RepID=UPI0005505109|nr:hypothetical protein [Deinococcus misasensis]
MLWLKQKLTALLGAALAVVVLVTFIMMFTPERGNQFNALAVGVGILLFGSLPVLLISAFSDWLTPRFGPKRKWMSLLVHVGLGGLLTVLAVQSAQGLLPVAFLMVVFWWLDETVRHPKAKPPRA